MDAVIFIEAVVYGTTKGVWFNLKEISSFVGDGAGTLVSMKNGDKHTVRDSFEEFCKKMRKAAAL